MLDLLFVGLCALLVVFAWAFVHLCDWLTEPSGDRYSDGDSKR
jgi:hypothetical protein